MHAICSRYVDLALTHADLSALDTVAIDETSYKRGHNYLTLAADADARKVVFVTEARDADAVSGFAAHLHAHKADPQNITCVSIVMSPAFIKDVTDNLSNAKIMFDKFHVIAHASQAVDEMRRMKQRTDPALKGLRWALLKNRSKLSREPHLDMLVEHFTTKRTARAWLYREQLRDILDRKQINVVSAMLGQWCTNVMRSKVEPMKEVAAMIRKHFEGIAEKERPAELNGGPASL